MIARDDITGIVLCGGRATRMGGVEKALQPLHKRPLVAHVLDRLQPQVVSVVISANHEPRAYAAYRIAVVQDLTRDQGPLGGLQAALPHVHTPWFFCCPGDAPFLDRQLVQSLAMAADRPQVAMVYPHDGGHAQPLFLLGRTSLSASLDAYLQSGERSVRGFVDGHHALCLQRSDIASSFTNINTPAELAEANQRPP